MAPATISKNAKILIAVAALGYFVDVYDLILFGVVRNPSLNSLGITDAKDLVVQGGTLFNWQMFGMLLGGILWGILGDKQGRKSVLFGSILLYSIANFANGFVHDLTAYAILRFIAGIGLAGELGAGITLVNETLPREKRGIGTLLVWQEQGHWGLLRQDYSINLPKVGNGSGLLLILKTLGEHHT
jgi:MFS transporter, putative metabolite:H+ symporter